MTKTTPAARWTLVDVAHAEALLEESWRLRPAESAPASVWAQYSNRHADVVACRDRALFEARTFLCSRCRGTGVTQWRHRQAGICFQCKGDGWSAKGRRLKP